MIPTGLMIKAGLYLAAVAALAGGLWYLHHKIDADGYQRGLRETSAVYEKRDREARAAADAEIGALRAAKDKAESESRAAVQSITQKLEKDRNDANRTIADLNGRIAAGFRLRDPYAIGTAASCNGGVSTAAASAAGSGGAGGGEFSEQVTQFLVSEAGRADQVARQLAACQALVAADRGLP